MASAVEVTKTECVRAAEELAETVSNIAERDLLRRFVAELYEHVPPADVAARSRADLFGAALALWRFAERRPNATAKVRVYNPDRDTDGWSSPHTIVEIVNDDMPFLVDSVTAAINDGGREVRLVNPGCRSKSRASPTRPSWLDWRQDLKPCSPMPALRSVTGSRCARRCGRSPAN
jgi:glutamate dehydrogenase